MIDNPMDLSRVHEKMLMGRYSSLSGFCRDMRLVFNNSRTYNTNKRSRVSSVPINIIARCIGDMWGISFCKLYYL